MIRVLLWDVDGTLLNFKLSEAAAIRSCFAKFHLGECTDEMLKRYSVINRSYWVRLESGELTRAQVLKGRFEEFFQKEGILFGDVDGFNDTYQIRLGDYAFFHDNSDQLVRDLKGHVKQYAVTNGTTVAQERKLQISGLDHLLDGVFISEKLGVDKPDPRFFDLVMDQIGPYKREEIAIIGDSLTSDIQGGNNAGIRCIWYNPAGEVPDGSLHIDLEIRDLNELRAYLKTDVG